jgi:ketosteroid isomerase-like protein
MSRENVEVVRRMYEAFNRADPSALDLLHPEAELHQLPQMPGAGSYYGRDEFARAMAAFLTDWEELRFELAEIGEAAGCVVAHVRAWGRAKVSGVSGERSEFHAWTMRDGKPHRCFVRNTEAEALEAVGLRE